tara:strand:- start:1343 stop:2698 length:1356 start_codon:yes stop_codon:yes gene_type:complete
MKLNLSLEKMKNLIINNFYIVLTNFTLFLFYFSISFFTPYQGDDFIFKVNPLDYSFNIVNFSSAIQSLWYWYNYWTGRAFGMLMLLFFLIPNKLFFDLTSSIIQVILINVIFYYAKGKVANNKLDGTILLLINFLLMIGFYGYSSVVFSMTYSINTTWTITYTLIYFILFLKYSNENYVFSTSFLFFIFGILSGCGLEQVFIAQLFFFLLMYFLKFKNKILVLPTYTFSSFLGVLIGGFFLFSASGNYSRARYSGYEFEWSLVKIFQYWVFEIDWLINYIKPFWVLLIIISMIYYLIYNGKFNISNKALIILFSGFISSLSLSLSPAVHHRGVNIFFYYCMIAFFLSLFKYEDILKKNLLMFMFSFQIISLFIFNNYLLINQLKIFNYSKKIEQEIIEKKENGERDIIIEQIKLNTNRFINYQSLFDVTSHPRNEGVAKYYNVSSIKAIRK